MNSLIEYIKTQFYLADLDPDKHQEAVYKVYTDILESKAIGTFVFANFDREAGAYRLSFNKDVAKVRAKHSSRAKRQLDLQLNSLYNDLSRLVRKYYEGQESLEKDPKAAVLAKTPLKKRMKVLLKDAYLLAYKLGVKGSGVSTVSRPNELSLSPEEKHWVNTAFKHEMRYFNQFFDQLIKKVSRKDVFGRIYDYTLSIRSVYEAGKAKSAPPNSLIYWVLHPAEHCPDCLELKRLSPFSKWTLPLTPRSGGTACLHNCKCTLMYKTATPEEVERVARANLKVRTVLKKLKRRN